MEWLPNKHDQNASLSRMPATLYTVFVPLNDNDGEPLPSTQLEAIQGVLLDFAGGLTQCPPCCGYWVDSSGRLFRDAMMPLQILVASEPETEVWITRFVIELAEALKQQQIFFLAQPVYRLLPVFTLPHLDETLLERVER